MQPVPAEDRWADTPWKMDAGEYNFSRFRAKELIADVRHTWGAHGIEPGVPAPTFELPRVGGGTIRLEDLRGKPVLLRFGSFT
jgi:hypothetical protein